jgi:hypothetical protein
VNLRAWRRSGAIPTRLDHGREDEFLDQHIHGGALLHVTTADAVLHVLNSTVEESERARLALRIFAEYVNALETLGAWGWSIRNRNSSRLLLDVFLSYAPGDVADFYRSVNGHESELSTLLRLPPTQTITDEFRRRGVPHGPLLAEFSRVEANLAQAAEHYFHPDQLFVSTYNKAKHGAPIIRDPDLPPEKFHILAPDPTGQTRYRFTTLSSTRATVEVNVRLTRQVSETTRALVSFARNLKLAELLY